MIMCAPASPHAPIQEQAPLISLSDVCIVPPIRRSLAIFSSKPRKQLQITHKICIANVRLVTEVKDVSIPSAPLQVHTIESLCSDIAVPDVTGSRYRKELLFTF